MMTSGSDHPCIHCTLSGPRSPHTPPLLGHVSGAVHLTPLAGALLQHCVVLSMQTDPHLVLPVGQAAGGQGVQLSIEG